MIDIMENLTNKQKYLIIGSILILVLAIGFIVLQFNRKSDIIINQGVEGVKPQKVEAPEPASIEEPKQIIVHVSGQVMNPGIVELKDGSRVNDALRKAGGETKFADIDQINLAAKLTDGEKIYIPKKGEKVADVATGTAVGGQSKSQSSIININNASVDDLDRIPGVGPSTAQKIIEYRQTKGSFKKIEDIKNISGIGDKKFESIKKYITT